MKIQIKSWRDDSVLFEGEFETIADALVEAVRTLGDAAFPQITIAPHANARGRPNLRGANLRGVPWEICDALGLAKETTIENAVAAIRALKVKS